MVIGALTSNYVSFELIAEFNLSSGAIVNLQSDVIDKLMPNLLPLLLTLGVLKLLNKNISTVKIMLLLAIIGFIGALIGLI